MLSATQDSARKPNNVIVVGSSGIDASVARALRVERLARRLATVTAERGDDTQLSAKAVIFDPLGRVLVLKSANDKWHDLPGGHVQEGEDPTTGLAREVREETGLSIGDIKSVETVSFKDFKGKPRTTLLYKATALSFDVRLSEEHGDFRWVKPAELAGLKLGYLAAPVQRTLDPVAISAVEAGHPFYGNQWVKEKGVREPVELVSLEHLESNPNEVWSERYRKEQEDENSHTGRLASRMKAGKPFQALTGIKVGGKVRIIDGQHRMNAARKAGLTHVGVQLVKAAEPINLSLTDTNPPSDHHETARKAAEKIYQAAANNWLTQLNADLMTAIFGHKGMDYDGVWLDVYGAAAGGWVAAMQQAARKAYLTTAQTLGHDAGVEFKPTEEALEGFAAARGSALERFPGAVRDKVAASIKRGLAGGEDARALARRVGEDFDQIQTGAARRVAATEAQVVYGVSQSQVLTAAGYSRKRWVTVGDDRVRDSHYLCEDQGAIPASEPFHNGLMYPGDPNGDASEVINCRCNLVGEL